MGQQISNAWWSLKPEGYVDSAINYRIRQSQAALDKSAEECGLEAATLAASDVETGDTVRAPMVNRMNIDVTPPSRWSDKPNGVWPPRPILYPAKYDGERQEVVKAIEKSVPDIKIVNVLRIENMALWERFRVLQQTMESRAADEKACGGSVTMPYCRPGFLFHGCPKAVVSSIASGGFNRSYCGTNACLYGRGVYFAKDASYSADTTYSPRDENNVQRMFACRVLTGESCQGKRDALPDDRLPDVKFDSTVNRVQNPDMWVLYQDCQAYPEYLVEFKMP